jgi:hypothetical protein
VITFMHAPEPVDRRALAALALLDPFGRPVTGAIRVAAAGIRVIVKREGRLALLEAPGFAEYTADFAAPPATPLVRSQTVMLDLRPADRGLLPRRIALKLPRNPDPALFAQPESLFAEVPVAFAASPRVTLTGNGAILRASIHRASDGAMVENALVRARTPDGLFTAWALTDAAGEAALVFPALPLSFIGPGSTTLSATTAQVVVDADPASARFTDAAGLADARIAAATRDEGFADPDAIGAAHPVTWAGAATVPIAACTQSAIALAWSPP